jgi:hypothetical protein
MIIFDLQCSFGHSFEGWFDDGSDFEKQRKEGGLACPICQDHDVHRLPSTFAIKASQPQPVLSTEAQEIAALEEKICEYVEKNFDNVGSEFASEALKMHYGVTSQRNIRGQSTQDEEKMLRDEGIPFIKVPMRNLSDT